MLKRVEGDRDPSRALLALRRLWWVIAVAVVVATAGAYVLGAREQPRYSASAALLFRNEQFVQGLFGIQGFGSSTDPTDLSRAPATNQSLLSLPSVIIRVAQQFHMPLTRVQSEVSIGSDATSDVVSVTATDANPAIASALANAYVRQYIAFRQAADRSQLATSQAVIKAQLAAVPPSERGSPRATSLRNRSDEIQLLASLQTGNAEVVQNAHPPTSPSSPRPKRDAIIGAMLGLLVGGVLVLVIQHRDRRLRSPAEIEGLYQAPIVGTVPESSALRGAGAVGIARDQDAFRMIRAQLRYFDVDRDIKHVLVTSADIGEGKSVVALNLARAAAESDNKRILLLDADLRGSSLARMTGFENIAGLSELLSDFDDLATGLRELLVNLQRLDGSASGLDVLFAGATPPNPVELLESRRMAELLEHLEADYDMVVVDSTPIRVVGDAVPLVHHADGVLVISRLGHSRRDHAIALMKQLRSLNANVLGVVINGFQPGKVAYSKHDRRGFSRKASTLSTRSPRASGASETDRRTAGLSNESVTSSGPESGAPRIRMLIDASGRRRLVEFDENGSVGGR